MFMTTPDAANANGMEEAHSRQVIFQ